MSEEIGVLKTQLSDALEAALVPYCLKHPGSYEVHSMLNRVVGGFPADDVLSFEFALDTPASQAKQEDVK